MVLSRATTVHWSFMGTLPPPQPQGPHPYSWRKAHRPLEDSWQWDPSLSTGDDDLSILKEPCWTLLRTPRHWLCLGGGLHLDPAHPASLSPSTDIAYMSHSNWPRGPITGDGSSGGPAAQRGRTALVGQPQKGLPSEGSATSATGQGRKEGRRGIATRLRATLTKASRELKISKLFFKARNSLY